MAPTKRRRTAASPKAASSPTAATTSSKSTNSNSNTVVYRVVQHFLDWNPSGNQNRNEETLQAFIDGHCWVDNGTGTGAATTTDIVDTPTKVNTNSTTTNTTTQPHLDCYWVVLCSQLMNRLVPKCQGGDEDAAVVLAFLSLSLANVLTADDPRTHKLEKACASTCASRSLVGRALLTTTVASLTALEQLVGNHKKNKNKNKMMTGNTQKALASATLALDRVVHLQRGTKDAALEEDDEAWTRDELEAACSRLGETKEEVNCLAILEPSSSSSGTTTTTTTTTSPMSSSPTVSGKTKTAPRKTRRGSKSTSTTAAAAAATSPVIASTSASTTDPTELFQTFQALLESCASSNIRLDGRVAVKRWASIALVWLLQGQSKLLHLVHDLCHHSQQQQQQQDTTPKFTLSISMRIAAIISESGSHCGLRHPTGAIDTYLRAISQPKPSKKKAARADIRDVTTVVLRDLIHLYSQTLPAHPRVLSDTATTATTSESSTLTLTTSTVTVTLHTTLGNLCRAAASSVPSSTYVEQGEWVKRLLAYCAATILSMPTQDVAVDVKLVHFALSQLADALQKCENHGTQTLSLDQLTPLPEPQVPKPTTKKKEDFCTFAGIFSSREEFTEEHVVALVLRGMMVTSERPAEALISQLIAILERAYDTREPKTKKSEVDGDNNNDYEESPKNETKKRGTKSKASKRKRRKSEEPEEPTPPQDNNMEWHRITSPRALVATEAWNALKLVFLIQMHPSSVLRQSIRKHMTMEHISKIVQLGTWLDRIMVTSRSRIVVSPPTGADSFFASTNPNAHEFAHYEKNLFAAHIQTCLVLGRGQTSFDSGVIRKAFFDRRQVYEAVMQDGWSLSLPEAQYALLASNLMVEPIPTSRDEASPERFLAKGYVDAIGQTLQNWNPTAEKRVSGQLFLDGGIPLSLRDARLFLLAVSRLPGEERQLCLDRLVTATLASLQAVSKNDTKHLNILQDIEASAFLARVMITCSCVVQMVAVGTTLREHLFSQVGPTQISVPAFYTSSEWYRSERCFMGLFSDWECPSLPDSVWSPVSLMYIKDKTFKDLKSLLELGFSMGMETARQDQCHLIFASWNGLGTLHSMGRSMSTSTTRTDSFPSLETSADDMSQRILQLREDVCMMHREIHGDSRSSPFKIKTNLKSMLTQAEGLLESALQAHVVTDDEEMSQGVPVALISLLTALPTYISASVAGHSKPGNDYFSTTLSKAAARRTKRKRGYSSESDRMPSDGDSVETDGGFEGDARVDALSRLRECCDAFGAAPIHPDWLDVSCRLREGITYKEATDNAEAALRCLTKLIVTAFTQYKHSQFKALRAFHGQEKNLDKRIALGLNLCQWSSHEPAATSMLGPGPYPDEREWKDDIASVCELHPDALELLLDESIVKNVEQAKEAWCPNAAQRLVGRLQDQTRLVGGWETSFAELRAGGEWELLLAEALTTACLDVANYPEDAMSSKEDIDEAAIKEGHEAMVAAQGWRNVCVTAASHLMPAAALLRLGVNMVGRKPHPFSFHENNQDPYDVAPLQFDEPLSGPLPITASLKKVVFETMTALTRLCVEGDDTLIATCHAISAHLIVDSKSFSDLEGLQAMRFAFMGLKRIRDVAEISGKEEVTKVVPFLVERLTSIIEDFGRIPKSKTAAQVESSDEFRRLLGFFGASSIKAFDTVVENKIEAYKVLTSGDIQEIDKASALIHQWKEQQSKSHAISEFVSILSCDSLRANERTRACIAFMLTRIADLESHPTGSSADQSSALVVPAIIDAFNSVSDKHLKEILLRDLCCLSPSNLTILDEPPSEAFRKDLALLLAFLLSSRPDSKKFTKSKLVFDTFGDSFESWMKLGSASRERILDVMFLYGSHFDSLKDIGSKLLSRASSTMSEEREDNVSELEPLTKFFRFVRDLQAALSSSASAKDSRSSKNVSGQEKKTRSSKGDSSTTNPRSCSFVLKSGFHGQHWYNCYTCGLVWDKGCCTLCALFCHKGHDVSYSRYSSFFCDCGAEDGSPAERNRVACKCLSTLPLDEVDNIFSEESLMSTERSTGSARSSKGESNSSEASNISVDTIGIEIARASFKDQARMSIDNLIGDAKKSPWLDSLFTILRDQFERWQRSKSTKSSFQALLLEDGDSDSKPFGKASHDSLLQTLRSRRSKTLYLQRISEKTLVPVRAAKGFQIKMSSDSSSNAVFMSRLAKNEISRAAVVTDSRGRMILAEPCSLLFCSAVPAVNVRHVTRPYETPLSRHQTCILGRSTMKFNIVGMRLCPENERHVVAWGTSEACVATVKPNWDGVEEKIDLIFDLEQSEGEIDYLVKCEWIPGSQTHIAVGCGRFVRIYDIGRTDSDKRAVPVIGYNLGFEAALRDLSIVPYRASSETEGDAVSVGSFGQEKISKLFLLLENGRLHVVDLKTGSNGKLESPGDQHFEPSECVVLATSGVRARTGSPIGQPGSTSRSLGEGSKLAYLKQSRLLLYKCASSCVLALMLGTKGGVEGSFELIPHSISSEILGNGPDGYSITGPFTHWTELGVAFRDGASFFRVACVGKSSRTSQPKLLCIEFNESEVKVKEIVWSSGSSMGLGLSLSLSFEGLAAFSVPFLCDTTGGSLVFGERAFLCAVTSNGSLLMFGEEPADTVPSADGAGSGADGPGRRALSTMGAMNTPTFPLTLFEKLKNVSESDDVIFGGDGIGSDPDDLKTRLSRDSSIFLMCPRREGCTLTVSLRQKRTDTAENDQNSQSQKGDLVIAALRILVGSTSSDVIPSKIYVEGRPVDLTPGVKKWYSLPLTEEEIALSVRNGLVSVGIGPAFDSSQSPSIDSIEVYAAERQIVDKWLPKSYFSPVGASDLTLVERPRNDCSGDSDSSNGLILSAQALAHLCELVGTSKLIAEGERSFLKQLVQDTALDREKRVNECVEYLLERIEPDTRARKSFYDESILFGCSNALSKSKAVVDESSEAGDGTEDRPNISAKWSSVGFVLQDCLKSATLIARERPMNYLQSMEKIVENHMSSGSIAVDASKLILAGIRNSANCDNLIGGAGGIVDLSLTEMAIELNTDTPHSKQFAKFDVIRGLLESKKIAVVERCCEAVSTFCRTHGGGDQASTDKPDLFTLLQHARLVAYQCDSCALFPMKEIRYTLLEENHDIDLCKGCFRLGMEYAETKQFGADIDVVIKDKTLGGDTKLTCAQMKQMQPVSLEKMDVEQVEVQSRRSGAPPSDVSADDDEELQRALRLSLGENIDDFNRDSDLPIGHQAYEDFVEHLFSCVVELLASVLKRDRSSSQASPLIRLLLDLVRHSRLEDRKVDRAKRFAKELSLGISHLLEASAGNKKLPQDKVLTLVTCLRAFSNLLVPEADSQYYLVGSDPDENSIETKSSKAKEKTSPKYACEVHAIPAVRRRCARGVHKDRRFYVCGKDRGSRCKYFVWADEVEDKPNEKSEKKSHFQNVVQGFLWTHFSAGSTPLHARLCRLLEDEVFSGESDDIDAAVSLTASSSEKPSESIPLKSFYSQQDVEKDFADGVFCSREKLQDVVSGARSLKVKTDSPRDLTVSVGSTTDRGALLLESSLDLLTLIADHQTEGISRWFSLLCEINISTNKPSTLRLLAKKVLKSLCGGNRLLYHSVRDQFAFGFQLKNLFRNSSAALEASLVVKEKARQCGRQWTNTEKTTWSKLRVGDLIGTEDLVSEDAQSQLCTTKIGKILDELWTGIKNRGQSWRRFCGLHSVPHSHREKKTGPKNQEGDLDFSTAAPIVALFWIACSLSGKNQIKVLSLIDLALTDWKERKPVHGKAEESTSDDENEPSKDGDDDALRTGEDELSAPEDILLGGDRKLTIDSLVAFAMEFVYGGRTLELRRVAYRVSANLCNKLCPADSRQVFMRLMGPPIGDIGSMGKTCIEFLNLLQSLARRVDPSVPVADAADLVMSFFIQQMNAAKFDRSNGEWAVLESGSGASAKRRLDLADCVFCLRAEPLGPKESSHTRSHGTRQSTSREATSSSATTTRIATRGHSHKKWHPEQVCPYVRGRLDGGKDAFASNEFCSFYTLKYRLAISELHLTVNDPRGRFVKTVTVYFTPRPAGEVSTIKSEDFSDKWQPCVTMNLPRGTSRASATLSQPIVAANLKIEFTDFYERPGGSKASDGSLLVHCPRCTRVVTNAHGVCGNCGEVAFQCRKCRHINYDRLDAFLCVECGYCASGNFSFELTAGVASNAVAICNDEDFERAEKIQAAATAMHDELKNALREKIRGAKSPKKTKTKDDMDSAFTPALKRAFLGLPPVGSKKESQSGASLLDRVEKQGSVVKYVARPQSTHLSISRSSVAADRTRSLLRLARQIRSESGSSSDRRRSSDVIIRHLGRGLAIDSLDDENDLIGLLEGSGALDPGESLGRVVASVQARRRAETGTTGAAAAGESSKKVESPKQILEDCERLHLLMREAERESYELNRRIQAWERLETDTLANVGTVKPTNFTFSPSHCSVCGGVVAHQLLVLWMRLFQARPSEVHIDREFLCLLLEDFPTIGKGLFDFKRQVVQVIATKSEEGAKLVLSELRKRLTATNDSTCAEILGKIMEVEGFSMSEEYSKLAMEILAAGQGSYY